jgi:hypothetical protein
LKIKGTKRMDDLKEKRNLKKQWSNRFLDELDIILEKCFLISKKKKEHFITKERIEIDLIRLLQSQKNFVPKKDIAHDLKNLALFDARENIIGRIKNFNMSQEKVEFEDMFLKIKIRDFNEVCFFDKYSMESVIFFDKQKQFFDGFTYRDTYRFLTDQSIHINS